MGGITIRASNFKITFNNTTIKLKLNFQAWERLQLGHQTSKSNLTTQQ
jgi:hypothetical protein